MTKHTGRRILSLILAVSMTFSMGITSAFAASGSGGVIDTGVVDTGHIHTKECFEVSIFYRNNNENGREFLSIDTTEENAKSDYFNICIRRSNKCPAGQAIPDCTAVKVTGELAEALKTESPLKKENYGDANWVYYPCRLSLTDKTKLKDSETVP
ncbi:MAG: hypothetical protein RR622_09190, partial [Hydrogenoanaerobacterium sp.]